MQRLCVIIERRSYTKYSRYFATVLHHQRHRQQQWRYPLSRQLADSFSTVHFQPLRRLWPFVKRFATSAGGHLKSGAPSQTGNLCCKLICFLCHTAYQALALEILSFAQEKGRRIVLQWIPGHCGLHGNETANSETRSALGSGLRIVMPFSGADIISFQD